jgi:O-antigen/teichoic acid export membrane protein
MFNFSSKMLITNMLTVVSQNVLTFIFGKLLPISTVGLFTQANKWNTMGSSFISSTMSQVAQPVLASINDEDNRQERVFRKMLRFTSFIAFPLMFGLALVAHEFILLTVGPTWERCVPLLQILCIGGSFLPLHTLYQNFIISRGRSDLYLRMVSLQIILQIGITLNLASQGVTVMVAAFSLLNVGFTLCWHFALKRIHKLSTADVLKDTLPFALIAIAIMVAVHYATLWTDILWFRLCLRVATAAGLYFLTMRLLHVKTLVECMAFIKQKRL